MEELERISLFAAGLSKISRRGAFPNHELNAIKR
jgi:hypothetical protein